jgi:hypothetical protein
MNPTIGVSICGGVSLVFGPVERAMFLNAKKLANPRQHEQIGHSMWYIETFSLCLKSLDGRERGATVL